jgi:anaerobic selenocysteine-containing dehydrogenase
LQRQDWLAAHTLGWDQFLERIQRFPPERAAEITRLPVETIVDLAVDYATTAPALLRISDGINRHTNGGQTVRTLACLPALTAQYGQEGGGLMYSTSDWLNWDAAAVDPASEASCPPPARQINMNRLGAALTGEVDPPVASLYVYNANPVASSPNAGRIVEGLRRDDLFTVVHELFETDTARYADLILPATSQLEQVDLHKPYGHLTLNYNAQAIEPQGEARSNWDVMRGLALTMGFNDPWLQENASEVIRGILEATAASSPQLVGITFERLQAEGTLPLAISAEERVPFADGRFATPSGRLEFYCEQAMTYGLDPLPDWVPDAESPFREAPATGRLPLLSPAAHHFISSTFANQPTMIGKERVPTLRIHPEDAAARGIRSGQAVRVRNERGWCRLLAEVTTDIRPGALVTTSVWWPRHSPDGRNVNWLTPDRLADLDGGSTFYDNLVTVEPCEAEA